MAFTDILSRMFRPNRKALSGSPEALSLFQGSSNPLARSRAKLLESYNTSPGVRSVVGRVSEAVACTNWRLFSQRRNGKAIRNIGAQRGQFKVRSKLLMDIGNAGELIEVVDHPWVRLMTKPNTLMTGFQCRTLTQVHQEMVGESIWVLFRNNKGAVDEILLVNPIDVQKVPTEEEPWFTVKAGVEEWRVPASEAFWFRNPDPTNPYGRGVGIAQSLVDEIDIAEYSAKQISSFFFNRGIPDAIISIENAGRSSLRRVKEEWNQQHGGFRRAYRTQWTDGKIDVKQLGTSFGDMELVELRKHTRDVLRETYGIPPEIVGVVENSNRATIAVAEYLFSKYTVQPRLEAQREAFQSFCEDEYDDRLIVHYDSPVQADRDFVLSVMKARPEVFKANEWRVAAEYGEVESELYIVPSGITAVESLSDLSDLPSETPATPAAPPADPEPSDDDDDDVDGGEVEVDEPGKAIGGALDAVLAFAVENQVKMSKAIRDEDVPRILVMLGSNEMRSRVNQILIDLVEERGQDVMEELVIEGSFNLHNPLIADKLALVLGERIDGITDTTRAAIESTLKEGIFAGESIDKLAERIMVTMGDAVRSRSKQIANNLVHEAAQAANYSAMAQSGVVEKHQWVTSFVRSRKTHVGMHGQVRAIGEPFASSSGATALHPHSFGKASEDAGCKCNTVAVIEDPKTMEALDKEAQAYDDWATPWETRAKQAVRAAFRAQRDELVDYLDLFR